MPNQHTRRTPKRPKSKGTARLGELLGELVEAQETIKMQADQLSNARMGARELESLSSQLDDVHEILARKNTIIRLLAMGDCTARELGLSDR